MNDSIYETDNLFAWCVASHDPPEVTGEQRAKMLSDLGFTGYAWGNRMAAAKELPRFHDEMNAMSRHGIKLVGRYITSTFDAAEMKAILGSFKEHNATPQLWVSPGHPSDDKSDDQRAADEAERLLPIVEAAGEAGLSVGMYNHAGWFGDPVNLVSIATCLKERGCDNVGLALCMHWCHEWVDRFEAVLPTITPHLLSMAISGVFKDGMTTDRQFPPVGAGDEDLRLLAALADSGWSGPVGIINHTEHDSAQRLADHLDGLAYARKRLAGQSPELPQYRTWPSA